MYYTRGGLGVSTTAARRTPFPTMGDDWVRWCGLLYLYLCICVYMYVMDVSQSQLHFPLEVRRCGSRGVEENQRAQLYSTTTYQALQIYIRLEQEQLELEGQRDYNVDEQE